MAASRFVNQTRHEIARKYGYRLRTSLDGDILGHCSDPRDPACVATDLAYIGHDDRIMMFSAATNDATAYFVAGLIRSTPK